MHRDRRRIPLPTGRASRTDRRLTPPARRALVCCAAAILASAGVVLSAELSTAELEEASEAGRRAASAVLRGADRSSLAEVLAADAIAAKFLGDDVWRRLSARQRDIVRSVIVDRFEDALAPPPRASAEIAWSAARPDGDSVHLFLGLRYPAGVLKTRWSLERSPSGWKVRDVLLSDPGISLADDAGRAFGRSGVERRNPGREARTAAYPRVLGLFAIVAIVLVLARRLAPSGRKILLWTAVAPAVLFAVDGFLAVRRALSEPYRIPEVLSPPPWSFAQRQALAAEREGDLDAARRFWRNAVAAGAPAAAVDYQIGVALASAGRRDEARAAFLDALSQRPAAPGAAKELGLIELAEGRSAQARDLLRGYLSQAGPDPDALSALAVAAANVGEKVEAVESIEEARRMVVDQWKSAQLQSRVYARAGDATRTVQSLREVESEGQLDREALRSDPAYLSIATDPAWVAFLAETPVPARTPGP